MGFSRGGPGSTRAEGNDHVRTSKLWGQPKTVKNRPIRGRKIGFTLPAALVEANETATVSGSQVEWGFPLADWISRPPWELKARYRPTKAGDAAGRGAKTAPAPFRAAKPQARANARTQAERRPARVAPSAHSQTTARATPGTA